MARSETRARREIDASHRMMQVTERELQRILLDIHDGPVQYMYAALSQLDLLQRALAADARGESLDRAERVRALLETGLAEMRDVLGAMRPPAFAARGLREPGAEERRELALLAAMRAVASGAATPAFATAMLVALGCHAWLLTQRWER